MPSEDADEQLIKAEIDEIVKKIDSIMQKVGSMDPARPEGGSATQE